MANIPLKSIQFPDLPDTYIINPTIAEVDGLQTALDGKADTNGSYDDMTVGNAEQLTSNIYEEDSEPYNFRTSGGSIDIGDRETDMLVGGTVAWNQMQPSRSASTTARGLTLTATNNDGSVSISGTRDSTGWVGLNQPWTAPANHKVLACVNKRSGDLGVVGLLNLYTQVFNFATRDATIFTSTSEAPLSISLGGSSGDVWNGSFIPQFFDLTQMFGSTIADYIYSLEQATAGAGVAWFRKLFPKPYYAYNAGELMSVQASSHDTVGFNAWDEEWELGNFDASGNPASSSTTIRTKNYIRVVPNTTYFIKGAYNKCPCYDADKNYIGETPYRYSSTPGQYYLDVPNNACYIKFSLSSAYGTTYKNDVCLNLSWDGERDGEYEAYVKHSYALDSDLVLRGIPKLDANNKLYYDGDTYESDGAVKRNYIELDVSTFTKVGSFWRSADNTAKPPAAPSTVPSVMCSDSSYKAVNWNNIGNSNMEIGISPTGQVSVNNTSATSSPPSFKIVCEKYTPTTETADPYTNPQIVNDFGTEEYVDYAVSQGTRDVAIPVGHQTQYMANLKAKLEMSPSSPEGAGDYIVRQTNGENEYVTLASNATIQNIIARLEALENAES